MATLELDAARRHLARMEELLEDADAVGIRAARGRIEEHALAHARAAEVWMRLHELVGEPS